MAPRKRPSKKLVLSLTVLSFLGSACSESVLYTEDELKGLSPALPNGNGNGPVLPPSTQGSIELTLAGSGSGGEDPLQVIFEGQNLDPFVVQNSQRKVSLDLRLLSEETVPDSHENRVHADLRIMIKDNDGKVVASRDFVSDSQLILKIEKADDGVENNEEDSMTGSLKSQSGSEVRLSIHATRVTSIDAAAAAKNPWKQGTLSAVVKSGQSVVLGTFEGFSH